MSNKTAGFLCARGLAVLLLLRGIYDLANQIVWLFNVKSYSGYYTANWMTLFGPVAYLAVAALLWRGAANFGPTDDQSSYDPLTSQSALGVAIVGISVYALYHSLANLIELFLWTVGPGRYMGDSVTNYAPDLATSIVAAILIPVGYRQIVDIRSFSDPIDESGVTS